MDLTLIITPLFAFLTACLSAYIGLQMAKLKHAADETQKSVAEVHLTMNSRLDQLVAYENSVSVAAGAESLRAAQSDNPRDDTPLE